MEELGIDHSWTGSEDETERFIFHGWTTQSGGRPQEIVGAAGSYFWDASGRKFLDFASQMGNVNIGHQHPRVVEAIQQQAARLCVVAPHFSNEARTGAARRIIDRAPTAGSRVFFTNGGADAIEHAVRMARQHTGRNTVLASYRSYHGATSLALHLSGDPRRWNVDSSACGVVHFLTPYLYRSSFASSTEEEEGERALRYLSEMMTLEGASTIAAVLIEPIVGTGGVLVPPPGYLEGVRSLCDKHGIVMIADEVMSGFGRAGQWFSVDQWGVKPDLITFSKGVNSGYVPLGGVVVSPQVLQTFYEYSYNGGLTSSGHPLACAAASACIDVMAEERLVKLAAWTGENVLGPGLRELMAKHPCVGDVRGMGVFWALELVRDGDTREMLAPYSAARGASGPMQVFKNACTKHGLWPFTRMNRVHLMPPCSISEGEVRKGLLILDDALTAVDQHLVNS